MAMGFRLQQKRSCLFSLAAGCLLGLVLAFGWEVIQVALGANFHTVVSGLCYRSGQLSPSQLEGYVREYGIRTVINLRGENKGEPWYEGECQAIRHLGVALVDVSIGGYQPPYDDEFQLLVATMNHAEYPILVHCGSGSDRSGLAGATFLLLRTDTCLRRARGQISLRYGHIPFGRAAFLDRFVDVYARWLTSKHLEHCSANFYRWSQEGYHRGDFLP